MNSIITRALPYIVLIIVCLLWLESCQQGNMNLGLYEDAQAQLQVSMNKQGQQTAKIKLLEAETVKDFLKMKSNDSSIIALQLIAKGYKGKLYSATHLVNQTIESATTATTVGTAGDTVTVDSIVYVYKIYTTKWDEQWSVGSITATKDSISRDIKIKNEFDITVGRESLGWFKGHEVVVSIKNKNPNTVTKELRTFRVKDNKKISVGLQLGVGLMQNGGLGVYGGLGVQYKVMQL